MEALDPLLAQHTVKNYVCASCWGHLVEYAGGIVLCANCGDETKGYVTKFYAEQRRRESLVEKLEISITLRLVLPNEHAGKTPEEITHELGF